MLPRSSYCGGMPDLHVSILQGEEGRYVKEGWVGFAAAREGVVWNDTGWRAESEWVQGCSTRHSTLNQVMFKSASSFIRSSGLWAPQPF